MTIDEIQNLVEKSILTGKQIEITYTNSRGVKDRYKIIEIRSTWENNFSTISESLSSGERKFRKFRYDRIENLKLINEQHYPHDYLIEKIRDGSLFSGVDNRILSKRGLKGYPSSINYVSEPHRRLTRIEAESLIKEIDIPHIPDWERAIILDIKDGDTYNLLLESDTTGFYESRLFGADTPESNEDLVEFALGLEAKVFVEDLFRDSRCCYVQKLGKGAYKRELVNIKNADNKDVAIELVLSGLALPMMGHIENKEIRQKFEIAARKAYSSEGGLWSIEGIRMRYNNIVSDSSVSKFDPFRHIPDKKSAIAKYLKQRPEAKIIRAAFDQKKRSEEWKIQIAEPIFYKITWNIKPDEYDLNAFKEMCDSYLAEIERLEESGKGKEVHRICIMHIEDMLDPLELGDGPIKGNFSKGTKKLIYHEDPQNRWYQLCIPEIRFRAIEDAKYCGFKKA